jgi:hypothetical protein
METIFRLSAGRKIKEKDQINVMKMFRQGDVLLVGIPPAKAKQLKGGKDIREKGRAILAHGEATGHAHVVLSGKETGRGKGSVDWVERPTGDGEWAEAVGLLRVKGRAAELRHDEHATIVLPRGTYRVVRQREYAPDEIRRVAD